MNSNLPPLQFGSLLIDRQRDQVYHFRPDGLPDVCKLKSGSEVLIAQLPRVARLTEPNRDGVFLKLKALHQSLVSKAPTSEQDSKVVLGGVLADLKEASKGKGPISPIFNYLIKMLKSGELTGKVGSHNELIFIVHPPLLDLGMLSMSDLERCMFPPCPDSSARSKPIVRCRRKLTSS